MLPPQKHIQTSIYDARGPQLQDCVSLLQRLQAKAQDPALRSTVKRQAAATATCSECPIKMSPDQSDASSAGLPLSQSLLTVETSKQHERQLIVTHNVAAGSVLWNEHPFVHLLLKQHRKQVCSLEHAPAML